MDKFHSKMTDAPMRVDMLVYEECLPAGVLAFADALRAANTRAGRRVFDVRCVALRSGEVACAHGVRLQATGTLGRESPDVLLVPGFWAESSAQVEAMLARRRDLVSALARTAKTIRLLAYCTGVTLLADAGRLDGHTATVTWWLADAMARRRPKVRWQCERDVVTDAKRTTAASVNGHFLLSSALLRERLAPDHHRDVMRLVALPQPVQPHPAFRAMSRIEQGAGFLGLVHELVETSPADALSLAGLSARLGVSPRTLSRRLRTAAGESPAAYVRRIKLHQVAERLAMTSAPLSSIAIDLGFSSDSNLARMFKAMTAMTPQEYRRKHGPSA